MDYIGTLCFAYILLVADINPLAKIKCNVFNYWLNSNINMTYTLIRSLMYESQLSKSYVHISYMPVSLLAIG